MLNVILYTGTEEMKSFYKDFIFILDDNKREIKKKKTLYRKK